MRLSPLRSASAAVIPLVFLAACVSGKADTPANVFDAITVGGTKTTPSVTFKTKPLSVKVITTKIVIAGKGAKLSKADSIVFNYILFNGKDGKQVQSSFGKRAFSLNLGDASLLAGVGKGLAGQKIGSRLLLAIPPADAFGAQGDEQGGFSPNDTVVFLIDLVSASTPLKKATGDLVVPPAGVGLPTVKEDAKGIPVVTVPKTPPPTKLVVQLLIKGKGSVVKAGQNLTAAYTVLVYRTGKVFDSSYIQKRLLTQTVGDNLPGFNKAIEGQTVGSRVLMVLPPAEGFGTKGRGSTIGPKDTLVFVVDILATS